nr:hypothetical protein Iba_chr02bCG23340 [Ipomoea batatas]
MPSPWRLIIAVEFLLISLFVQPRIMTPSPPWTILKKAEASAALPDHHQQNHYYSTRMSSSKPRNLQNLPDRETVFSDLSKGPVPPSGPSNRHH